MKRSRLKIIVMIIIILIPTKVLAHPGRLNSNGCHQCNSNCEKWGLQTNEYHCHSGNTYTNSKGEVYDSSGIKISNKISNDNTPATNNNTSNNNTPTTNNNTSNNNQSYNNYSSNKEEVPVVIQKSNDISLKYIKINNQEIAIEDEMYYEAKQKNIELDIKANDSKTKIEYDNKDLEIGTNEIIIKAVAESGDIKEYKLIINRIEVKSNVTIKKFILGAGEVEFKDNKATIKKLVNESSFEYTYELSDKDAKLLLYVNDKEVTKLNNIKNNDIIKLVIVDKDDNKNIYEIKVTDVSKIESLIVNIISYTLTVVILIVPIIVIGIIIYKKRRK